MLVFDLYQPSFGFLQITSIISFAFRFSFVSPSESIDATRSVAGPTAKRKNRKTGSITGKMRGGTGNKSG